MNEDSKLQIFMNYCHAVFLHTNSCHCISLQLMEGEKNNQVLRSELRDQEELVHRMMSLETENNALSAELGQVGWFELV